MKIKIMTKDILAVIRDDTGERVLVNRIFVRWLSAERVEILVPTHEGTGRVVPEDPAAN